MAAVAAVAVAVDKGCVDRYVDVSVELVRICPWK